MNEETIEFYRSISVLELTELSLSVYSTMLEQLTLLVSVIFAYFATAYVVGSKLSNIQLSTITLVYSAFVFVGIFGYAQMALSLGNMNYILYEMSTIPTTLSIWVCILAWIVSIVFMVHTRRIK
jgi:hypothetical protein